MSSALTRYRFDRRLDFYVSMLVGLAALVVGLPAIGRVLLHGDHGALGSAIPWGLWVSVYVYFVWLEVGMVLGYYALKHVLKVEGIDRLGPVVFLAAASALVAALTIIGMDLGQPFRAWRTVVFGDFGSLMTWMIWLHSFYIVLLVVEFIAYRADRQDIIRRLNWITIPAGIALIGVIGSLFGVVAARPLWNSSVLPMAFAMSSLVAGTALILILHLLFSPDIGTARHAATASDLARYLFWALVIGALAALANLLTSMYAGVPARVEGMRLLLFGPYAWTIWIVHLLLGTLVPLVLLARHREHPLALLLAAGLLVTTFVSVPLNLVIPGLAYPTLELRGVAEAFHHPRLAYDYFPSPTEWKVVIGAAGLGLCLFALAYRRLLEPLYRSLARDADR